MPETGFTENWQASLGLTIDQYLPFSSLQDPESDYSNVFSGFFSKSPIQVRNEQLRSFVDEGEVPEEIYNQYTKRRHAGRTTDWDGIAQWANENIPDLQDKFVTQAEMFEKNKEILANRKVYADDIFERSNGWGIVGQLAGGMHAGVLDPVTVATLPLAAPSLGVSAMSRSMYAAQLAWRSAALNMGVQLAMEPFVMHWNEQLDSEYTLKDAMINVGAAGLFGGFIGLGSGYLGHGGSVQGRWFAANQTDALLSKNYDELFEVFKSIGMSDKDAEIHANYKVEENSSFDDVKRVAGEELRDQQARRPDVEFPPEEKNLAKRTELIESGERQVVKLEAEARAVVHKEKLAKKRAAEAKKKADEEVNALIAKIEEIDIEVKQDPTPAKKKTLSLNKKKLPAAKEKAKTAEQRVEKAETESKSKIEKVKKKVAKAKEKAKKEPDLTQDVPDYTDPNLDLGLEINDRGRGMMTLPDGSRLRVQKNEFDELEVWEGADMVADGFNDLDEILEEFVGVYKPPPRPTLKGRAENLEETQMHMENTGAEAADYDPLLDAESLDELEIAYEGIGDDIEFFDGENTMSVKDMESEYDQYMDDISTIEECLYG